MDQVAYISWGYSDQMPSSYYMAGMYGFDNYHVPDYAPYYALGGNDQMMPITTVEMTLGAEPPVIPDTNPTGNTYENVYYPLER